MTDLSVVAKKSWSTHIPVLAKAISLTDKDVLELGSGFFSTPVLHWTCKYRSQLQLYTYENHPEFFKFAKQFQSRNHRIRFIENWDELKINKHWGVVLIDHEPNERRGKDAVRFKDHADYIIIHDSEWPDLFGYTNIWGNFKYRYDWKDCRPWATVLSNFKKLDEFGRL